MARWLNNSALCLTLGLLALPATAQTLNTRPLPAPVLTPPPVTVRQLPPDAKISVATPEVISGDSSGLLDERSSGLPHSLWQNSDRKKLEALLPSLPQGIVSDAVRGLVEKLLLARGEPPRASSTSPSWLMLRLQELFALGLDKQALAMIDALPPAFVTQPVAQLRAEMQLLSGDAKTACGTAQQALASSDDTIWRKLVIFCQANDGKGDEAQLGIDALSELGKNDAFLAGLVDAINNKLPRLLKLPRSWTTADATLLAASGKNGLTQATAPALPLPVLRTLGAQKTIETPIRVVTLEKAVKYGAADAKILADAYNAFDLNPKALAEVKDSGVQARALLYQQQAHMSDDGKRIGILRQALRLFEQAGLRPVADKLFADALMEIEPASLTAATQDFAADAARILFAAGHKREALAWFDTDVTPEPQRKFEHAAFGLLQRFSEDKGIVAPRQKIDPIIVPVNASPRDLRMLYRLYTLMEPFGYDTAKSDPQQLVTTRLNYAVDTPSPTLLNALEDADRNGRKGEALLLSVLVIGGGELGNASDSVLLQVVRTWIHLGYVQEARALAVEATLAVR